MRAVQPSDDRPPNSVMFVNGRRVGVSRFGSLGGWPLVWCHGGLSCGLDARYLDAAGQRYGADIIAIDRPGIRRSDASAVSSIAQWPHTVEQVAEQLCVHEFAVAGWSAGGPYALACAAAMPQRVRAVATLAGMAPLERTSHVLELGLWTDVLLIPAARRWPRAAAELLRLARGVPDRFFAWQILRSAGSRDRAALQWTHQWLVAALREATIGGTSGTIDDYRRFGSSWGFELDQIRRPVTVWQGEQDTLLPMSHARRLASTLPSSELRVVPSTGHYLPAVIANEVLADLAPSPTDCEADDPHFG